MTAVGREPRRVDVESIKPLETLPIFMNLNGRAAVFCGAGPGALWKCELLAAAGADLRIFCPVPDADMVGLADRLKGVGLFRRTPTASDFEGAAIAVIDSDDLALVEEVRAMARKAGALVNVVDKPSYCDFSFGSIVNRSPLVVGIATGGAAPVFGQAVRARIEAVLPERFGAWAVLAKSLRPKIAALAMPFRRRRAFWEYFVDAALRGDDPPAEAGAVDTLFSDAVGRSDKPPGKVILVGSGPGDPDLLTIRAVRALQSADVVLFDDLAPPRVLELARREAQKISVGKRGHAPSVGQTAISALLVDLGLQGKTVVRLKGGDPSVFGRANEELAAAQAAGIACEIIPGVTAALAAAAAVGASLSERERARRIQFITAHSADGALPEGMEWRALVDADAATAVYMGVKTLPALVDRLLAEGLDPATPAVIVESASLPHERRFAGAIAKMPALMRAARPTGPCILLYGRTLDRATMRLAAPAR